MKVKGSSGTKIRATRPLEFKARVVQLKVNEGKSVGDALVAASEEHGLPVTDAMRNHPHSVYSSYVASINKALEKGSPDLEALVKEYGIAQKE